MMMAYQIFTDATADMSDTMTFGWPTVEIIPMEVTVGDDTYTYGDGGTLAIDSFYAKQRAGQFASTSQINPMTYREAFEPYLKQGIDIVYLCFSSGLSNTIQAAQMCIQELQEEYPDRQIICLDTLCASVGEGLLVREALRKQAEGYSFDALCIWIMTNRLHICHWFTVDTFAHLRHGGRVSAVSATMGTALQIKPLLHVDNDGTLKATEKPRGSIRAMQSQIAKMQTGWMPELGKTVVIGHGDSPDSARILKELVVSHFPDADVHIANIGPVIGAHSGPGTLVLSYWGSNR